MMDRVMEDTDLARRIIRLFLEDMPRQISKLRECVHKVNPESIEKISHGIKSAAGSTGSQRLSEAARDLENMAAYMKAHSETEPETPSRIEEELNRLEEEFRLVEDLMRSSHLVTDE